MGFIRFWLWVPSGGKLKYDYCTFRKSGWSSSKATVIPATARGYWGILSFNNGHQFSPALPSPSCLLDLLSGWLMRLVTDGQGPRRPRVHTRAWPRPELACRGSVWPTAEAPSLLCGSPPPSSCMLPLKSAFVPFPFLQS